MIKTQWRRATDQTGCGGKQHTSGEEQKLFNKAVLQMLTCPINNQTPGEISLRLPVNSAKNIPTDDDFLLSLHEL